MPLMRLEIVDLERCASFVSIGVFDLTADLRRCRHHGRSTYLETRVIKDGLGWAWAGRVPGSSSRIHPVHESKCENARTY